MKKTIFIICLIFSIFLTTTSCTNNVRARVYGGNTTINLEKGEKLVEVTWKGNNIWYLTEPMEDNYKPKTKIFREDSNIGILNGKVTFIESK